MERQKLIRGLNFFPLRKLFAHRFDDTSDPWPWSEAGLDVDVPVVSRIVKNQVPAPRPSVRMLQFHPWIILTTDQQPRNIQRFIRYVWRRWGYADRAFPTARFTPWDATHLGNIIADYRHHQWRWLSCGAIRSSSRKHHTALQTLSGWHHRHFFGTTIQPASTTELPVEIDRSATNGGQPVLLECPSG